MLKKHIPFGVGLVGRVIQERETIYMTHIPNEYINITSGLGEDSPKQLLIIPLIFNEEVFGAVELASFTKIEDYQIAFVERIGEVIASTLSMVKINIRTSKLLEETKLRSEEMSSQEEEIRQNVEEMKTSQEELNIQVTHLSETLDAINSVSYIVEFDMQGRITDINDKFLELLGAERKNIIGRFQGSFSLETQNIENFNKFWERLQSGHIREYKQEIIVKGEKVTMKSFYVPLINEFGDAYKVLSIATIEK
jgi:methyl-accepting chemotaxis protein